MSPKVKMWLMLVIGFIIIGFIVFLLAGTTDYWQAWIYLAVGFISMIPYVRYVVSNPILLENRTKGGPLSEQRPIQKFITLLGGLPLISVFIIPALDRRFGWTSMPSWVSIIGDLFIIVSMWMVYRVFKENSYGSATIEISKEQKVISTGPYGIVRNPMYSSAIVYCIALPLSLGSYWGIVPAVLMVFFFAWRLSDEEKFLSQNLPGYKEYQAKVRWHLIPRVF
jgi:protein-S-isoprenylcysteine O-methyltransferase Ste14